MNTFEEEIIVYDQHLDDLRHVNNIKYVEWVQKIAKNHWKTIASTSVALSSLLIVTLLTAVECLLFPLLSRI